MANIRFAAWKIHEIESRARSQLINLPNPFWCISFRMPDKIEKNIQYNKLPEAESCSMTP